MSISGKQRTIQKAVVFEGIGLHTGHHNRMVVHPAPENHGYKFRRMDLDGQPFIEADVDLVVSTKRGTTLEKGGVQVHTTEHILAALYGSQVDNALIELNGPEIPIMDGSALEFVDAIEGVGFSDQDANRKTFKLRSNVAFEDSDINVEMLAVPNPDDDFRVTVMVDYRSPVLGTQHATQGARRLAQSCELISIARVEP